MEEARAFVTRAVEVDVTTTTRVLAWARSVCEEWWSPQDAAAALGVPEGEMRVALGELEDMGLVYRAVASRDAYRVTADGRLEAASLCEENPR